MPKLLPWRGKPASRVVEIAAGLPPGGSIAKLARRTWRGFSAIARARAVAPFRNCESTFGSASISAEADVGTPIAIAPAVVAAIAALRAVPIISPPPVALRSWGRHAATALAGRPWVGTPIDGQGRPPNSGFDQAAADRVAGKLDAVREAELLEDVRAVPLDRLLRQDELLGDPAAGVTL